MTKARPRGRLPFYIGQPADEVNFVARASGRRRRAMDLTDAHATWRVAFKNATHAEVRRELQGARVELLTLRVVVIWFDDCSVTITRQFDAKGFVVGQPRVTAIGEGVLQLGGLDKLPPVNGL